MHTSSSNQPLRVLAWPKGSSNPYTPLLYSGMGPGVVVDEFSPGKLLQRYDVWHIHWPESLLNIRNRAKAAFKLNVFLAAVKFMRSRGTKIVWTMHNFKAHEGLHPEMEGRFWPRWIPRVDGIISLSETGLAMAREKFPRLRELPAAVTPHGHYRDEYPRVAVQSRESLGIPADAKVVLFFGAIRPYKNVDALVRAFRGVSDPNAQLWVVGQPNSSALTAAIESEVQGDTRIRLVLEFVKNEEVAKYMQIADLVVLPYRSILNSGSALLALSFDRPVLVPDLGSMGDLRNDFGKEWVKTFDGDLSGQTLDRALEWAAEPRPPVCFMQRKYDWSSIRAETVEFYRKVISRS